jgi:hypothetical protein
LGLIVALSLLITACDQNTFLELDEADPRPLIEWTSPAEMATLSGSTTFNVAQAGDVEFASVKFTIHNSSFTRSTGSLTVDVSKLGIPAGPMQASATATTLTGIEFTAYRTFLIPEVGRPTVTWQRPYVLEAIEPNRAFDMTVNVSDASGTITELRFFVDGNHIETMRDITDVATEQAVTFRWQRGFDEPLGRVMLSVEARNALGGVTVATREVLSIPARPIIVDTVKPRVWWDQTTVWQNRAIAGTHVFKARAEDDVQVAYFDFLINDALVDRQLGTTDNSTNLPRRWAQWSWNTLSPRTDAAVDGNINDDRRYPDGEYTVTVVAVDTSGNRSEVQTLNVRVANDDTTKPVAQWHTFRDDSSLGNLYDGKVLTGITHLTVLGADNNTVALFEIWVGSTVMGTVSSTDDSIAGYPFSREFSFDTRIYQSGYHTLGVVAVDQAGNRSEPAFVDVIFVNTPDFVLQSLNGNYGEWIFVGGSDYDFRRYTDNVFHIRRGDAGYNLSICAVRLMAGRADNNGGWGATTVNFVSYANNTFSPDSDPSLFQVEDNEAGAFRYNWKPRSALARWQVNGTFSDWLLPDTGENGYLDENEEGLHWPMRFRAQLAVSHSQAGCDSNNQAFITFVESTEVFMNGSYTGGVGFTWPGWNNIGSLP